MPSLSPQLFLSSAMTLAPIFTLLLATTKTNEVTRRFIQFRVMSRFHSLTQRCVPHRRNGVVLMKVIPLEVFCTPFSADTFFPFPIELSDLD